MVRSSLRSRSRLWNPPQKFGRARGPGTGKALAQAFAELPYDLEFCGEVVGKLDMMLGHVRDLIHAYYESEQFFKNVR